MRNKKLNWFQNVEHREHPHQGLNWLTATISVPNVVRAMNFYTEV
ncbi:MAG: VOC family protein, partial [Flavobacterium sp.]